MSCEIEDAALDSYLSGSGHEVILTVEKATTLWAGASEASPEVKQIGPVEDPNGVLGPVPGPLTGGMMTQG